jgi:hypothetical protein
LGESRDVLEAKRCVDLLGARMNGAPIATDASLLPMSNPVRCWPDGFFGGRM